jgi:class 3 adenylate cyclase/tetratricopeptide (TPR) repeat protein
VTTAVGACPACGTQIGSGQRFCRQCGAALSRDAPTEFSRTATIVTSDLQGSTALGERLDPESLREVMTTYIDGMRSVFERHGGTIEKIIGDAIVAVFGLPTPADDDALRAVEAAAESQRALTGLNEQLEGRWGVRLVVRTGVATGEVIVGEASAGQHVLTGPTLTVATAMEQNSPAHEVLLAESTYQAVRDEVEAEPMGAVTPKGTSLSIPSFRLVAVAERDAAETSPDAAARVCPTCGTDNADGDRYCVTCGSEQRERRAHRETRKTVTVIFADPKPSTVDGSAPDPGALRDVMSRYFAGMQRALERHGATVEKFIGDAVMAVFGLPIRHEDDALRAVRAARDMQDALPALNAAFETEHGITLANHIGVNTGEVVAGDASLGQRLVTGDTVNVAARLEQAAGSREILLGPLTYRLVRDAVEVDAVEPLTLKGKAEPVPAYRLVSVRATTASVQRRADTPMVGREQEMEGLRGMLERAIAERGCRLATVVGDAGVGKTRLVTEFTTVSADSARVIRGRCLPYGDGITFWPLRELVRDACGIMADDAGEVVQAKLKAGVPDGEVSDRLATVIGASQATFPVPELLWAARRFLEHLGSHGPVLAIVDDVHWAESTFLDLIDSLVESVADAPILLLCTSRHQLIEQQPEWGVSDAGIRLVLEPLSDADAGQVVESLLGGTGLDETVKGRILQAAAGNPLFVEQLLSMLIDDGTLQREGDGWVQARGVSDLSVPPTIQALLAARLDLLEADERDVIEPASVVGQNFAVPAVVDLVAPSLAEAVPGHLVELSGKQLVQPNAGADAEGAYRFQHLLVRDAAYNGLLKRERADLHQRFVAWAETYNAAHGVDNREFEEIHGYHLEQAHRYLSELGTVDSAVLQLGRRAADKLASAGRRAMTRGDTHAAASLLERATGVLPDDDLQRGDLLPRLGEAYLELGSFDDAAARLDEAVRIARAHGDERLEADANLVSLLMKALTSEMADWADVAQAEVSRAIPIFEGADDAASLALAYRILVYLHGTPGRYGEAAAAARQVITYARAAGERRLETRGMIGYIQAALLGPTPVVEAIAECQDLVREADGDRRAEGLIKLTLSQLYAMRGEFGTARDLYREARAMLADIRAGVVSISTSVDAAQVEFLAGDPAAAAALLREDAAALEAVGEQYIRSTVLGLLARAHVEMKELDEACALAESTAQLAADDDVDVQVALRSVKARCLMADGSATDAVDLSRQTLELSSSADNPRLHAYAEGELAEALAASGNSEAARAAWERALSLYRAKGDEVSSRNVQRRIAEARRSQTRRRAPVTSEGSA